MSFAQENMGIYEHDKYPPPPSIPSQPIQISNRIRKQPTERSSENRSAEEQVQSPLQFVALVVHRDEIDASGEEACFEEAEQEAHGDQTGLVSYEALADGGDAPEEHDGCEPG